MDLSANGRYEVNAGDRTSWTLSVYLENRISASPKLKVGTDRIDEQCSADGAEYRWLWRWECHRGL
jgi:hypothetical protein